MAFISSIGTRVSFGAHKQHAPNGNKQLTGGGMFGMASLPMRIRMPLQSVDARQFGKTPIRCSDMGISFPTKKFDESLRVGIISTRWNGPLVGKLRDDVKAALQENGVSGADIVEMQVPGSFELPLAARLMSVAQKVDAIVCIGVLIKGGSEHYEYIASTVSKGIMDVQLSLGIPIVFGVLCCQTQELAEERSQGELSQASNWAKTALEMGTLRKSQIGGVSSGKKSVGFF